jgi:hypothetical protein
MKPITEPYYTIGTGNGNVMYCLRFVENDYKYSQGQIVEFLGLKSSYICNLSTDFQSAIKKHKQDLTMLNINLSYLLKKKLQNGVVLIIVTTIFKKQKQTI